MRNDPTSGRSRRRASMASRVVATTSIVSVLVALVAIYIPVANDRGLWPFAPSSPDPSGTPEVCGKAAIDVSPVRGPVGTSATAQGCGFGPDEGITLSTGGDTIATGHTDGDGRFSAPFAIGSAFPRTTDTALTIAALGDTSHRAASTEFTVTAI